jgi:hypothetical protein
VQNHLNMFVDRTEASSTVHLGPGDQRNAGGIPERNCLEGAYLKSPKEAIGR